MPLKSDPLRLVQAVVAAEAARSEPCPMLMLHPMVWQMVWFLFMTHLQQSGNRQRKSPLVTLGT